MQAPNRSGPGATGSCIAGLFWDPAKLDGSGGTRPDFMDHAVIYGLSMALGDYATNVVGYFGSVRAYTDNGYDYTWVFV
jgi:hypothetical protein